MAAGVIDIGSNSVKLLIGEPGDGDVMVLESLRNISPIGRSTFLKGYIAQEPINLTIEILHKYRKALREYQIDKVFVIATTAVREASNRNIFVDTVRRKTGFEIEVLNVGDIVYYIDAYIAFKLKERYPVHNRNLLICEMGAGSVDVSFLKKGFTVMNTGLALGSLRFRQLVSRLGGSMEETTEALQEYIENEFAFLRQRLPAGAIDDIFLIDENQEYLRAILPNRKIASNFFQFGISDVEQIIAALTGKTNEEISEVYDMPPEGADALLPYMIILKMFFELTRNPHVYILETSLAEAVLANKLLGLELSRRYNKTNQLLSVAHSICEKYHMDLDHAKHTSHAARILFEGLAEQLGLEPSHQLYLVLAAYLHDIGKFISNRSHHKHSEYIINSLNLSRLTEEEVRIIACVARYHRRGDPSKSHLLYNSLAEDKQILVQKLSALLRLANALDHSHRQKVKGMRVLGADSDDITVQVDTRSNFLLEKNDFNDKKDLLEKITGSRIKLAVNENF